MYFARNMMVSAAKYRKSSMNITAYPEINALPGEWVQGIVRLLDDRVIGIYLSGSLAYGDFVPDRSDIDLQTWCVLGSHPRSFERSSGYTGTSSNDTRHGQVVSSAVTFRSNLCAK
jgi:hypothetical protein